jgi:hypothetical protein
MTLGRATLVDMRTRRLPLWGSSVSDTTVSGTTSTRPRLSQVPAETDRLVRLRADGECEACRAPLSATDTCSWVYVALGWNEDAVYTGPANALILCTPCRRLADALDTQMEARGIWVWSGPDPRLMPMVVPADGSSWRAVWRSEDGRYLLDPPELPSSPGPA